MTNDSPRLVVHALPGAQARKIATALTGLIGPDGTEQGPALSAQDAARQLSADPEARLCLLYEDPVRALCAAMSAQEDIAAVLQNWTAATGQALDLHRHNRKRSTIYEAAHLQRFAAAGLARLGVEADSRLLGDIPDTAPPSPLAYIMAQAILAEDQDARAAHDELVASTQTLSNEEDPAPADLALQAYAALRDKQDTVESLQRQAMDTSHDLGQQLARKTAHVELLLSHQADIVADMEELRDGLQTSALTAEQEAEQEKAGLQAQLQTASDAHAQLMAQQAAMIADMEELQEKLEQNGRAAEQEKAGIREKLDAASARNSLLADQQAAMLSDMQKLEQEMDAREVRAMGIQHSLRVQLKAVEETRDRVLLERDQRTAELKAALETQAQTAAALTRRDEDLTMARREIDRIMGSRSMRLTGSLRKIAGLLRGRR